MQYVFGALPQATSVWNYEFLCLLAHICKRKTFPQYFPNFERGIFATYLKRVVLGKEKGFSKLNPLSSMFTHNKHSFFGAKMFN